MTHLLRTLLILSCCWLGASTDAAAEEQLLPIEDQAPAPDFALPDIAGQTIRLADYRGKPVILNFWATWCPPCLAEMPTLQRAHDLLAGDGIAVIGINVGDAADAIKAFLSTTPVSFPLLMDADTEIAQRYPVIGLPTTFIIDPQGQLVYSATGELEWDAPAILDQVRALKR